MQLITHSKKPVKKTKECTCVNPTVIEKSFNENIELEYDKVGHIYRYNGQALDSVTSFIKKYYKPFELEMIAKTCAKSWNVSPEDIIDIWEDNKNSSALFGTAIHDTLEHYEKHKKVGEQISSQRGEDENYALPKHPILRKIVKDFVSINRINGEVLTEVLITDIKNGLAGRGDRIVVQDWDKKICRIGDYKINVEADKPDKNHKPSAPFDGLPPTKVTKYQIQMSLYANMLSKFGWTVTGLDVYVLEDEWKYYELPVLKIIE